MFTFLKDIIQIRKASQGDKSSHNHTGKVQI